MSNISITKATLCRGVVLSLHTTILIFVRTYFFIRITKRCTYVGRLEMTLQNINHQILDVDDLTEILLAEKV